MRPIHLLQPLLLIAVACGAEADLSDRTGDHLDGVGAALTIVGTVTGMTEPLAGAYVIAEDARGRGLARAISAADGAYSLAVAEVPARLAIKAATRVPRWVHAPYLQPLGGDRHRFDYDVGPPLGADTTAENVTYLVLDSGAPRIVPHVVWGSGGGVGSPFDELGDLIHGARVRGLISLLPSGVTVHPNVEQAVIHHSTPRGDYLEARFSAALNNYSLGAAATQLMIQQIVATTSHNFSDQRLPVKISVACGSCAGGYEPLRDGHVGPTGPGGSYEVLALSGDEAFPDLAGHPFAAHVAMAKALEVATGFTDGTFRPDAPVTRAQFVVYLLRTLKLPRIRPANATFSDVGPSDWYYSAIETARAAGLASGYSDGTFRPNAAVTRAELASFIVNAARWPLLSQSWSSFEDVPATYWASRKIETAHAYCQSVAPVTYWPAIRFEPRRAATRAETIAALMRMTTCFTGDEVR